MNNIDSQEQQLLTLAKQAASQAYAPYSHFPVGAALLTEAGNMVSGCNVENASFGLTQCAERSAITSAVNKGQQRFTKLVVYTPTSQIVSPCGACRQVINEFMPTNAEIISYTQDGQRQVWTVSELLPNAFNNKLL